MEKTIKRMSRRKKVAFVLIAALVITAIIPIMSFAGDSETLSRTISFNGCDCVKGNKSVNDKIVVFGNSNYKDGAKFDNSIPVLLSYSDEIGGWTIDKSQGTFKCSVCEASEWINYSNQSANLNGKNIQMKAVKKTPTETEDVTGYVEVEKVSSADSDDLLKGATFSLYKDGSSEPIATDETDEYGYLQFDGLEVSDDGVTYTLKETIAPEGYTINATDGIIGTFKLTTKDNSKSFTEGSAVINDPIGEPVEPEKVLGSVQITKQDSISGEKISGAIFGLTDKNNKVITAQAIEGVASWSGLELGEYTVSEIEASPGYNAGSFILWKNHEEISKTITIDENNTEIEVVGTNDQEKDILGSLELTKISSADERPISGAVFSLEDANGNIVTKTAIDGIASWSGLALGDYTLREDTAASGFAKGSFAVEGTKVDDNGYTVSITEENADRTLTATNDPLIKREMLGSVELTKIDSTTGLKIDGAVFALEGQDGTVITAEAIDGVASWNDIPLGDYTVTELEAADGYLIESFRVFIGSNELVNKTISLNEDTPSLGLIGTNDPEGVKGQQDFPADNNDGGIAVQGNVLGQSANPGSDQNVLGEEAKTSDSMNIMLIAFLVLSALAIAGGLLAQRKLDKNII